MITFHVRQNLIIWDLRNPARCLRYQIALFLWCIILVSQVWLNLRSVRVSQASTTDGNRAYGGQLKAWVPVNLKKRKFGDILSTSLTYDSNRCNHKFWVPSKTCDVQIESFFKWINGQNDCRHLDWKGRNLYVVVQYLKDLTLNSIPQDHVTNEYPINYNPLYFTGIGKIFLGRVKIYIKTSAFIDRKSSGIRIIYN